MLVTRIYGGLGNQMFQYAAGKSISLSRSEELMLDTSSYGINGGENRTDRDLDILETRLKLRNLDIQAESYRECDHILIKRF